MATANGNRVAWAAFALGATASIAANVADAARRAETLPEIAAYGNMAFAAFAPLALLLVAEMLMRQRGKGGGFLAFVRWAGAALVAGVSAYVSYSHMRELLLSYHQPEDVATLLPLAVDGLMLVASAALADPAVRHTAPVPAEAETAPAVEAEVPSVPVVAAVPDIPRVPETPAVPEVQAPASAPEPASAELPEAAGEYVPNIAAASGAAAAAREAFRAELAKGRKLTGAELAGRFGKSDRWGRLRIAECRA